MTAIGILGNGKTCIPIHAYCNNLLQDNIYHTISDEIKAKVKGWNLNRIKIEEQFSKIKYREACTNEGLSIRKYQNNKCIKIEIIPLRSEKVFQMKTDLNLMCCEINRSFHKE